MPASFPDWFIEWCECGDRGMSSETIAAHMLSIPASVLNHSSWSRNYASYPHDSGDLGRCIKLLDLAEENRAGWRERMPEMSHMRGWSKLIPHWAELEQEWRCDMTGIRQVKYENWYGRRGQPLKRPKIQTRNVPKSTWMISMLVEGHSSDYLTRHNMWEPTIGGVRY